MTADHPHAGGPNPAALPDLTALLAAPGAPALQLVELLDQPRPYRPVELAMRAAADWLVARGQAGRGVVLLLEHQPVYTLGARGSLLFLRDQAAAAAAGIAVERSDRGGDITYHGPGQLVAYPVVHLGARQREVQAWVGVLEQAMLDTCADLGVVARRRDGMRGLFVEQRKLGAVGVHIDRGVSRHGLALNIAPRLDHFGWIVPCGLTGIGVTSVTAELGKAVALPQAAALLAGHLLAGVRAFCAAR